MNRNFFQSLPDVPAGEEVFEPFIESETFFVERIVSNNSVPPKEGWYEQSQDEWVMVIQGSAVLEFENQTVELHSGDTYLIKAMTKHKVAYTSSNPVCVWLAVHSK